MADFGKLGYDIVGISTDDIDTLAKFQKEEMAPQRFVSDPGGTIAKAFGNLKYAKEGLAGRVTFVVGTDGKILYKVDDPAPESNVASVFDWVKQHPYKKAG